MTQNTLGLGGGPAGPELATVLAARGRNVTLADGAPRASRARETDLPPHEPTIEIATLLADCAVATDADTGVSATTETARRARGAG